MSSFARRVIFLSMTATALLCQATGAAAAGEKPAADAVASETGRSRALPSAERHASEPFYLAANRLAAVQEETGKQEEKDREFDPKTTTRVTLGSSSGTPGTSVVVPIYFTPAEGVQVGRLKLDVDFVSVNLKFSKLDAGIAAELGNVDLSPEVKVGKNEKGVETTTLTIQASFLSPEPPEKGIPAGLLGYLTLRISEDGRPASIALRARAEAAELGSNQPLENLRAFDATVDVLAPGTQPLVTCFFFSH